ncbi:ribose 5-phosphate isomerase B [uncultured Brachyspira sp.]|uniref:ribose 5-phosphate isomerase B n=1 Tax=uncultured Brachyspira sp. TaxID=221953 RepID=UPI0025E5FFA2|nr:ribose 5-phosphate isomerase B [uncultured Brachyspira sp.]
MKIAVGCDHSALELKREIIKYLEELGHEIKDFGAYTSESSDYPIYGKKVADEVAAGRYEGGVLICGTGIGISLSANKVKGIRAAVCSEPYSAKLSKQHNNSNIIAFGSRVVGVGLAKMIVKEWLDAEYEGGRHAKRVGLIAKIENGEDI